MPKNESQPAKKPARDKKHHLERDDRPRWKNVPINGTKPAKPASPKPQGDEKPE